MKNSIEVFNEKAEIVFKEYMLLRDLEESTIIRKTLELKRFIEYVEKEIKKDLRDFKSKDIEDYFIYLSNKKYSKTTLQVNKTMVKDLFYALNRNELLLINPMEMTEICIKEHAGIKEVLDEEEVEKFLGAIKPDTGTSLRDRTIFELMYVTGMRIGEAANLEVGDIDFSLNEVVIRDGKNRKDRIVPLGKLAKEYLDKWINHGRSWFIIDGKDDNSLFLNSKGERISSRSIRASFKRYIKKAGIEKKKASPHSLRHSCATSLSIVAARANDPEQRTWSTGSDQDS